jgi:hypothetical protein
MKYLFVPGGVRSLKLETRIVTVIIYGTVCVFTNIWNFAIYFRVLTVSPLPSRTKKKRTSFQQCTALVSLLFFVSLFLFFWRQRPFCEVFVVGVFSNYSLFVCHGEFSCIRVLLNYVFGLSKKKFCYAIVTRNKINLNFSAFIILLPQNNVF